MKRRENSRYPRYASIRDAHGLNDYAVSKATGVPASTISDWKNEKSQPGVESLIKIARVFGISVEELVGDVE